MSQVEINIIQRILEGCQRFDELLIKFFEPFKVELPPRGVIAWDGTDYCLRYNNGDLPAGPVTFEKLYESFKVTAAKLRAPYNNIEYLSVRYSNATLASVLTAIKKPFPEIKDNYVRDFIEALYGPESYVHHDVKTDHDLVSMFKVNVGCVAIGTSGGSINQNYKQELKKTGMMGPSWLLGLKGYKHGYMTRRNVPVARYSINTETGVAVYYRASVTIPEDIFLKKSGATTLITNNSFTEPLEYELPIKVVRDKIIIPGATMDGAVNHMWFIDEDNNKIVGLTGLNYAERAQNDPRFKKLKQVKPHFYGYNGALAAVDRKTLTFNVVNAEFLAGA